MKLQGIAKFVLKILVEWTYPMAQQVVCVSKGLKPIFVNIMAIK